MDSESTSVCTGIDANSDDELQSDEDNSRSPPRQHPGNEMDPANGNCEDSNDSEDAVICLRPPKKKRSNTQLDELDPDKDEESHAHRQSPSPKKRRKHKNNHTQYSGKINMPAKTQKKNTRHQGNNNSHKHDRQSNKTKYKKIELLHLCEHVTK